MFFPESFACNALKKLKMSAPVSDLKRFKRAGFRFQNGSERIHILPVAPGLCPRPRLILLYCAKSERNSTQRR